jgi:hypothetical protein
MQDRELYRRILGIESPWYVERVDLKLVEGEVHVYLEHEDVRHWACPECGAEAKPYDPSGHHHYHRRVRALRKRHFHPAARGYQFPGTPRRCHGRRPCL